MSKDDASDGISLPINHLRSGGERGTGGRTDHCRQRATKRPKIQLKGLKLKRISLSLWSDSYDV